jgi:hypothetical protein
MMQLQRYSFQLRRVTSSVVLLLLPSTRSPDSPSPDLERITAVFDSLYAGKVAYKITFHIATATKVVFLSLMLLVY